MQAHKNTQTQLQKFSLLACVLLLSACGQEATPSAPAVAPQANAAPAAPVPALPVLTAKPVVEQLLTAQTIGMHLDAVAQIAGPAVRTEAHRHLYRVDGCEVTLRSEDADKVVQAVDVVMAPGCQASLAPLLGA